MSLLSNIFILLLLFIAGYFFVLVKSILAPFVVSLIFAYLLYPLILKLRRYKVGRHTSVFVVTLAFFSIFILAVVLVVPHLYRELLNFIDYIPKLVDSLAHMLHDTLDIDLFEYSDIQTFKDSKIYESLFKNFKVFLKGVINSGKVFINIGTFICLIPIITFYLLKDWDILVERVKNAIPKRYYDSVLLQFSEIDHIIFRYMTGQMQISFFLGCFYTVGLALMTVPYFALIGVLTGILSIIPYVGTLFAFVVTNFVVFSSGYGMWSIVMTNAILISGQMLETTVISPKILGKSVDMNPVWIIFAIFAGGAVLGFLGVCIAVPVAAILKVVIKHQYRKYLGSAFYNDKAAKLNRK
ncbi:AI-2E family transporter [Anaplasmataceae bacterium AB001_6]|nr:AI-2E family transporter [Anaplasmataceae bacterium AB001_6]